MWFNLALIPALLAIAASATPLASSDVSLEARNNDKITYLGSKGATLSGGTKFGNLVFVSGQVPILNGTVVPGGIKNETAFVLARIGDILKEAGTDWSKVLKTTVLLQGESSIQAVLMSDVRDLPAMNEVYAATVPNPKPARAAFEVGNLPVL